MTRHRGLDGLRGAAAVAVLVGHTFMTDPTYVDTWLGTPVHGLHAVLAYSPLHLFWDGSEAVDLFFVLSGFVLVLPFLATPPTTRWREYYPQRLIRLLLPIWAAIAFAVAVALAVPRSADPATVWLAGHARAVTLNNVKQAAEVLRGGTGLNTALWSMQWEVLFSLLLPLFVVGAFLSRRMWWLAVLGGVALVGCGARIGSGYVEFLPMFLIGSVLAASRDRWRDWFEQLSGARAAVVGAFALLLVNARWTVPAVATSHSAVPWCAAATTLGAALLVCLCVATPSAIRFGSSRAATFLGAISFSLYLVHEPIVVSLGQIPQHGAAPWLVLALALPLSIGVAWLFHVSIERPALRWSHRIAGLVRTRAPMIDAS